MKKFFARLFTVKALKIAAFMALFAVSAVAVSTGSQAAFSGSTDNEDNSWSTGSVTLTDNDSGSALFAAENIVPGYSESRCITITSGAPGLTNLYMTGAGTDSPLSDAMHVSMVAGAGSSPDCTDFVYDYEMTEDETFAALQERSLVAPGFVGQLDGGGIPSSSITVKITVELPDDGALPTVGSGQDALMNQSLDYTFTWFNQTVNQVG